MKVLNGIIGTYPIQFFKTQLLVEQRYLPSSITLAVDKTFIILAIVSSLVMLTVIRPTVEFASLPTSSKK